MGEEEKETHKGNKPRDSWDEWSRHVLSELKRMNEQYEHLSEAIEEFKDTIYRDINSDKEETNKKFTKMHVEIEVLKVKAGVWGLAGGAITVAVALGIKVAMG
jgi:uncharacterized protein YdcH (DUF465 family)